MIRETECVRVESCNWALAEADEFLQMNPNLIRPNLGKKRSAALITSFFGLHGHPCCHGYVEDQAETVTDGVKSFCLVYQIPRKIEHMLSDSISCSDSLRFSGLLSGLENHWPFLFDASWLVSVTVILILIMEG